MADVIIKKRPARILVAEDEPSVQKMVGKRLEANGYEVILASDGEEALKLAYETDPDLIVMDIIMPKIEGDDVANRLQQNDFTAHIPVIFLTCLVRSEEAAPSKFIIGTNRMLPKPIDTAQLLLMIEQILHR